MNDLKFEIGDYITNEGPGGRWVRVVEIRNVGADGDPGGWIELLFEIPEPVRVSGETRYWIKCAPDERAWVDMTARAAV